MNGEARYVDIVLKHVFNYFFFAINYGSHVLSRGGSVQLYNSSDVGETVSFGDNLNY